MSSGLLPRREDLARRRELLVRGIRGIEPASPQDGRLLRRDAIPIAHQPVAFCEGGSAQAADQARVAQQRRPVATIGSGGQVDRRAEAADHPAALQSVDERVPRPMARHDIGKLDAEKRPALHATAPEQRVQPQHRAGTVHPARPQCNDVGAALHGRHDSPPVRRASSIQDPRSVPPPPPSPVCLSGSDVLAAARTQASPEAGFSTLVATLRVHGRAMPRRSCRLSKGPDRRG